MGKFELLPTPQQWLAWRLGAEAGLQSGDVLIKRIEPVAAMVVDPGLPLFPVDANFLVVRGLVEIRAWWIAYSLNYPAWGDYLLSKSGRSILGRITLRVLRDWAVAEPPPNFQHLARRLADLLQKRTFLAGQITALQAEVETAVSTQMEDTAYDETEQRFSRRSWSCFFPAPLTQESWLPHHVASDFRAEMLHRDSEWQPLRSFLTPEPPPRNRFTTLGDPIPVLRLRDVGRVPLLPTSVEPSRPMQANRVYRYPVQAEDVLLSTMGSSPCVAFAPERTTQPVYPVDHWERLRFRSHAAAFSLILQTGPVTRQLRTLASGSMRQFVRAEDIHRLFLPVLPSETLAHWDRGFRSLAKAWQQIESQWHTALAEGWQAFFLAHNLSATGQVNQNP